LFVTGDKIISARKYKRTSQKNKTARKAGCVVQMIKLWCVFLWMQEGACSKDKKKLHNSLGTVCNYWSPEEFKKSFITKQSSDNKNNFVKFQYTHLQTHQNWEA